MLAPHSRPRGSFRHFWLRVQVSAPSPAIAPPLLPLQSPTCFAPIHTRSCSSARPSCMQLQLSRLNVAYYRVQITPVRDQLPPVNLWFAVVDHYSVVLLRFTFGYRSVRRIFFFF